MAKEYIIWGKRPDSEFEEPLFEGIPDLKTAKAVETVLLMHGDATETRFQVIDLEEPVNFPAMFAKTINI